MRFEINLSGGIGSWALRAAGVDAPGFKGLSGDGEKAKLPRTLACVCRADPSAKCALTVHRLGESDDIDRWQDKSGKLFFNRVYQGKHGTHVELEIDDEKLGRAIRKKLEPYSFENDGELVWWTEHSEIYQRIDKVLAPDGLTSEKLGYTNTPLTRRAIDGLIALAEEIDPIRRDAIHWQFSHGYRVARADRAHVATWLVREFESCWFLDDQLSTRLYQHTCPQIADDLIRFIKDKKYGDDRWPLALALARTKHPRSADVIITLLGQGVNTRGALEALAKLPAHAHVAKIRKYLRDPDSDVRRQAKKTLQKLGFPVETPPPSVHLAKSRKAVPKGMHEWSTSLDMDDLATTLQRLSRCVDSGFGQPEIAEVIGVAEELPVEQTKVFRFHVKAQGQKSDLWLVIFMDDTDSPDLGLYAHPELHQVIEEKLTLS